MELAAESQKQEDGTGYLGVQPGVTHSDLGFFGAVRSAAQTTASMVKLIFVGLKMMFSGQVPVTGSQGLAGPVGIIQLSSEAFQGGYYLMLLALISVNLAILNMLPLLPLDGGHVLFSIIETHPGQEHLAARLRAGLDGGARHLRGAVHSGDLQRHRPHLRASPSDGEPATGDGGRRGRRGRRSDRRPVDDQHPDRRCRGHALRRYGRSPPPGRRW